MNGNNVTFYFETNTHSYYQEGDNLVRISINTPKSMFNLEALFIHELGHFVYTQVYTHTKLPFNADKFMLNYQKYYEDNQLLFEDQISSSKLLFEFLSDSKKIKTSFEALESSTREFFEYEKVARTPIDKAAQLIGFNISDYEQYKLTPSYTEFFKLNSYIDLFIIPTIREFVDKESFYESFSTVVFNNILSFYLAENKNYSNSNVTELTYESVLRWAEEIFLSEIIEEFKLTSKQIFFLVRIADYINRSNHLLSNEDIKPSFYDNEIYDKLMVRSQELRAAGVDEEILDSFKGIDSYHIKYVSPILCDSIKSTAANEITFAEGFIGEACLTNEF